MTAEPASLLERLRRYASEEHPGDWKPKTARIDGWMYANRTFVENMEAALPEIIEAFSLLSKVRRLNQPEGEHANLPGVRELVDETRAKVCAEVDALLSKVSQT